MKCTLRTFDKNRTILVNHEEGEMGKKNDLNRTTIDFNYSGYEANIKRFNLIVIVGISIVLKTLLIKHGSFHMESFRMQKSSVD